jgi:hypothetical protein
MRLNLACTLLSLLLVSSRVGAAEDKLNEYLVDITGGTVSAGALVGLDKGITQIETSQDLIAALQPLSSGDGKSAFGLAITPARTRLMPMSGHTYLTSDFFRLLGSVTLSYAQNFETLSGTDYKKSAYSLGTVYYIDKSEDPVFIGNRSFVECAGSLKVANAENVNAIVMNPALDSSAKDAALKGLTQEFNKTLSQCIADRLRKETRWNAAKASLSFGNARIEATSGGTGHTLARNATLNVQYGIGEFGLLAASLRHARDGLDTASLGSPDGLVYKRSSLLAARFTYGDNEGTSFRTIVEASNARSTSANVHKDAFIYAFGLDRKIGAGIWLELRVGRNRAQDNGKEQTTTLLNLNLAPSLLPFKF